MALHEIDIWDRALARVGDQRIIEDLAVAKLTSGSDATAANPVALNIVAHGYATDDLVMIRGFTEMTEVNGRVFKITKTGANSFTLNDEDGTGYTAETTGGSVFLLPDKKISKECFDAWTDVRDEVLREHPWNDCVKRIRLARKEAAEVASSATAANPVVVTTGIHGYSTGDLVLMEAMDEMTEVNNRWFTITVVLTTTFELDGEDGTLYTAESTGGTATKALNPLKPDSGFESVYTLPTDHIRVTDLVKEKRLWLIEGDELLTDAGITVPITYIFRQKDVTKYDPLLTSVMSARLAVELVSVLAQGSGKQIEVALSQYQILLDRAKRSDALEQSAMPGAEDEWVLARQGIRGRERTGS